MLSARDDKLLHSKQPLFQKWYLGDIIGEGSSGTVYEITDKNGNRCALKVIPVTIDDIGGTLHLKEQDSAAKEKYLDEMTSEILAEVRVMEKLEHNTGIVKYQEYDVIEATDSFVRLILIKMQLLQPLNKVLRIRESEFTQKEAAAMGIDILTALSECRKHNIIHRDIKPSNIFVTDDNQYLLGDFGSARLLEKTMMASHKGTLAYMAPEIAAGQPFNSTADIYSLGIVIYQLLNNRRLPLLKDGFKFSDIETAVEQRLSGVSLPHPEHADNELGEIICRMCAYLPKDRYASPEECLEDLKNYISHNKRKRKRRIKPRAPIICILTLVILLSAALILTSLLKNKNNLVAGISSGNVNSSGAIASDEKWLYYSQDVLGERGIRVSKDGKVKEVICDYNMHDINITQDYLIFTSLYTQLESDPYVYNTGLYRMDKDGNNPICLDDSTVFNPITYGEYVYYLKDEDNRHLLCRIPIQGGETETLSEVGQYTYNFYLYGDQLYITDTTDYKLISLDIYDGTKTVIINEYIGNFCIEDGILYCCDTGFNNKIYIHELSPSSPTAINLENCRSITLPYEIYQFNVSDGVIYAACDITTSIDGETDKGGIWCINSDGSDLKQIYAGNASHIMLTSQKLYFVDDGIIYYMDLDGNNITEMDDMSILYILE